jgi:hypothetical protein
MVRNWLAWSVTMSSLFIILVLAIAVIWAAEKKEDAVKLVLAAVLPLLGSWVGTILAYFYSSESLKNATSSVATLTQHLTGLDRLRATLVRDKMIKRADFKGVETRPLNVIKVSEARQTLEAAGVNRLMVLDANDIPKLVVHRSLLDRFVATKSLAAPPPANLSDLTLKDMMDDPVFRALLGSTFEMVREEATLAEVKSRMERTPNCQDIFVTRTGSKSEPALGWITNVIIEENSRV